MSVTGISHITLLTKDMNATIRFYTQILGVPLVRAGRDAEDPTSRLYYFKLGENNLIAFQDYPGYFSGSPRLRGGMLHLSIQIESFEKLMEARENLLENQVKCSEILSESFYNFVSFHDNNGFRVNYVYHNRELDDLDLFADTEPSKEVNNYLENRLNK